MNRTPSALKWLAERRARLAYDLLRTNRMVAALSERQRSFQQQLDALDVTIKVYDARLDPKGIFAVNGWKDRYGPRGTLKAAMLQVLADHAPEWVAIDDIATLLIAGFELEFPAPGMLRQWKHNTLGKMLKRLLAEGVVERRLDATCPEGKAGYWRLKPATELKLSDL